MALINCPKCTQQLELPDGSAGKTIRCPKCQQAFATPVETAAAPVVNMEEAITDEPRQPKPVSPPPKKRGRRPDETPPKSSALLPILLIGGGLALGLCFCGAVGITASFFSLRAVKQAAAKKADLVAQAVEIDMEQARRAELEERDRIVRVELEKAQLEKKQAEENAKPQHGEYKRLQIPNNRGDVRALTFSADGSSLYAATIAESVYSWNLTTWTERTHALAKQPGGPEISAAAFSPTADKVLFGRHGGRFCSYDLTRDPAPQTSIQIGDPGRQFAFNHIAVAPDGLRACTSHGNSVAFVWEITPLNQIASLTGFQNQVFSSVFHPKTEAVAAGAQDVQIFEPKIGKLLHLKGAAPNCFRSLAFSRDGHFFTGVNGNTLYHWNVDDPKANPVKVDYDQAAVATVYSPDGRTLAVAVHHTRVFFYDSTALKQRFMLDLRKDRNNWDTPGAIAYHPDSQRFAVSRGSTIYLFKLNAFDK